MPPETEPEEAWIAVLINDWTYTVWNTDLEEGRNIFRYRDYDHLHPPEDKDYLLVWTPGVSANVDLGHYDYYIGQYPIATEIHSRRSPQEELSYVGLLEVHRIIAARRKTIGQVVSGYRKIWKDDNGEDISSHHIFKRLIKIRLQASLTKY